MKQLFLLFLMVLTFGCDNKKKDEYEILESQNENLVKGENIRGEKISNNVAVGSEIIDPTSNQYLIKDPSYLNYQYQFKPLSSEEILIYNYSYGLGYEKYIFNNEEYMFRLSAKNTATGKERILGYWNISYGNCQLSDDGKLGIFSLYSDDYKISRPLFKIDGRKGSVKYLFEANSSFMSTHDLNYLLFQLNDEGLFLLADLNKDEFVRAIEWRKSDGPWGSGMYRIFRSLDPKYEFRIDFNREVFLEAIAYYNIERNQLNTLFDVSDTDIPSNYAREREEIQPEELGY